MTSLTYPGAQAADREYPLMAGELELCVHEWGDPDDPPLMLAHGGLDFARTFDVFAPLLARAGWRVVSWDHRGHGDSAHADLYSWEADLRDTAAVFDQIAGRHPVAAVGHSKGGALMLQLADAQPFRFRAIVNIDGIPARHPHRDIPEHERTKLLAGDLTAWLDHRGRTATTQRRPGTIDELARRRQLMNPRLSLDWLRYLVTVGGYESDDGWRWKLDPAIRIGGFGPWQPEWALRGLVGIGVPFYGLMVEVDEPMGWGSTPDDITPFLPTGARLEVLADTGHFAHIEHPHAVAERVLDFLGAPA
ncbi:MAG: alpha/beta hydrolase [Ilumatobacter coccineus]|uniref:Alpha/beta hydrolase n=1 Tax=Ilumatobacter coccineus TaxID=467094 RepID=A0A2G6K9E4_9ACTN|nr:MAG: alpha/beta hydrolase [Ilumatobacter coccineus]